MPISIEQVLPWLSVFIAVVAAGGAIASSVISRKVYLSQTRPDVIIYIEHDRPKGSIVLWIKNIGNGVAYDVTFNIGDFPGQREWCSGFVEKLNADGIRMIAPGSSINTIVGITSELVQIDSLKPVSASVSYFKQEGKKRTRLGTEFILDYGMFAGTVFADTEEHKTRKAVEAISREIKKSTKDIVTAVGSIDSQ